jgi:hypothetical protein
MTANINIGSLVKNVTSMFINVGGATKQVTSGFINVTGSLRQFFTSALYPYIANSSNVQISSQYYGVTLYGHPTTGTAPAGSYSYVWQYSTNGSTWYSETGTGASGTTTTPNTPFTYTTDATDVPNVLYIRFQVTYGSNTYTSNVVNLYQYQPVLDTTTYPSDPVLSGTLSVGSILSISSHWKATTAVTNDTLPSYYTATWSSGSGTRTYSSRSTDSNYSSTWYQYTTVSGDVGSAVSVYVTAYNSNPTATTTVTRTSGTIVNAWYWSISSGSNTPTTPNTPTLTQIGNNVMVDWASSRPSDTGSYTEYVSGSSYIGSPTQAQWINVNNFDSTGAANYPTGPYEDYWPITSGSTNAGLNVYVVATGSTRGATVAWGTAPSAITYRVTYTISGASSGNGTFQTAPIFTTSTFIDTTAAGGTVTVTAVQAYSDTGGVNLLSNGIMSSGPSITPVFNTSTGGTASGTFTYLTYPSIPTSLSATTNRSDGVNLTFGGSTNATSYDIFWNTVASSYPSNAATPDFSGVSSPYLDTTIGLNTTQYYWVRGKNANGTSNWFPFQTNGVTGTRTMISPTPTSVTWSGGTFTINFSGGSGPYFQAWYQANNNVLFGTDASSPDGYNTVSPITTTSLAVAGNTYYWWVRSAGTLTGTSTSTTVSAWTGPVSVTIPAATTTTAAATTTTTAAATTTTTAAATTTTTAAATTTTTAAATTTTTAAGCSGPCQVNYACGSSTCSSLGGCSACPGGCFRGGTYNAACTCIVTGGSLGC